MRFPLRGAALATLALAVTSCADGGPVAPLSIDQPLFSTAAAERATAWVSEFHYDNTGADTQERVEITAPAGTNLAGWKVVLYNGSNGSSYGTINLEGVVGDQCGGLGVAVFDGPGSGIQNGAPDGLALVDAAGTVRDLFAYEGEMVAVGGPADGWTLPRIAVTQSGSEPIGSSLMRDGDGVFFKSSTASPATFGSCNGGAPLAPVPPAEEPPYDGPRTIVISEIHGEPVTADSDSWGEWFEVYNYGAEPVNLKGFILASGGTHPSHAIATDLIVAPGAYAVLSRSDDMARNGGVAVDYDYFVSSSTTIYFDDNDWLALRDPSGVGVDSIAWSVLAQGASRGVRDLAEENREVDGANWGYSTTTFGGGDYGTPGGANTGLSDTAPTPPAGGGGGGGTLTIVGRTPGDAPLPVGFQDQIYAQSGGSTVTAVWTSQNPEIATIDELGVITALRPGTATFVATSASGATGSTTLPIEIATRSSIQYRGNTEFGEPTDADASDDILIRRDQLTSSFNPNRGTPNWVSYNLDGEHFGSLDRCDCFTMDPELSAYPQVSTADYTNSGYSRGHMVRSADRDAGSLDNAYTYYFSNIVPQHADNNTGPWGGLETYLGGLAATQNREVYIVAGVHGSLGTMKNEGKVVIPGAVWKVALVLPRDQGLDDIDSASDILEVIAVVMPNVSGIAGTGWTSYSTTVDVVEATTGYDLFAALPDHVERLIERGGTNSAPTVAIAPVAPVLPGETVTLTSTAADADGDALTYEWRLPDGQVGTTPSYAVTFGSAGTFVVELVVTDAYGLTATSEVTVTVRSADQSLQGLLADVRQLVADGTLTKGQANVLETKLEVAIKQLEKGHTGPASNQLDTFLHHVKKLAADGDLSAAQAAALADPATRVLVSINR